MAHASHAMNLLFTQRSLAVAKAHVQCVATGREKNEDRTHTGNTFYSDRNSRVDSDNRSVKVIRRRRIELHGAALSQLQQEVDVSS